MKSLILGFIIGLIIGFVEVYAYFMVNLKFAIALALFFGACGIVAYAVRKIGF